MKKSVYMTVADRENVQILEDRWGVGMAEVIRRAVKEAIGDWRD